VRIEDIDRPRVVPGSAEEILASLRAYALEWDGDVVYQSQRSDLYDAALARLRSAGLAYDCACSRADVQRASSAQHEEEAVYPGTCRDGIPAGRVARAIRFRAPENPIAFDDLIRGRVSQSAGGDFVVKRADGLFAYQLAVVVDDAGQGVNQVIRGGDLLASTGRQIALQQALGLPSPRYGHLPLVTSPDGRKLGKRDGALPLATADSRPLFDALTLLGIHVERASPREMLSEAAARFEKSRLTAYATVVHNPPKQ
jgi:glutamyl-Q tRNA(Asp) synthetase